MERLNIYKLIINATAVVFALAVLAAAGITMGNRFADLFEAKTEANPQQLKRLIKAWHGSVEKGEEKRAVLLAKRIADPYCVYMPELPYLKLFRQFGLNSMALTSPFGEIDYLRWRDAVELQQLADRIVNSADVSLEELFAVVNAEICPDRTPVATMTIMDIWRKKSGGTEDRIRLLGGLSAYFGYRMTVVYLTDASGRPVYALAEFVKNERTAVADFLYGRLYCNTTVQELTTPNDWPAELKAALTRAKLYFIPAELADYRNVSMSLYQQLGLFPDRAFPLFTVVDPLQVLNLLAEHKKISTRQIFFWTYPLIGAIKSDRLPASWRIRVTPPATPPSDSTTKGAPSHDH